MSITNLLDQKLISIEPSLKDKEAVLSAIAELSLNHPALKNISKEKILQGLREREELGSTGFGKGIAIPHCRIAGIDDFILGVVILPDKVDFKSLDNEPIGLAVFLIAPEEQSNRHIRLLSAISQALRIPGAVDDISAQRNPELVRESFLKYADDDATERSTQSKNLFHVVITDEDIFHEILPLFAALETSVEFVVDAKSSNEYISKVPLFAGLLNDDLLSFRRVIVATVEKRMTNETIRRIEDITGSLDKTSDVMLIVQEVIYASENTAI